MDANECNTNHLDADVRLPPRKRLLAGLKKQSCPGSNSPCSQENNSSPSPSPSRPFNTSVSFNASPLSEFDVRLNYLLKSYKNGSNMSPEEIAKAAGLAAEAAEKAAEVARAEAEEKAAIAAKAVAAAKSALDLVASLSDDRSSKDKLQKKNKLKKHIPVEQLYTKYQLVENSGTDEEAAKKLHRTVNSSPKRSKPSAGSDSKNKHKKLKSAPSSEKSGVANGASVTDDNSKLPSTCNGVVIEGGKDCEGSNEEPFTVKGDNKVSKAVKSREVEADSVEAESSQSKKPYEVTEDVGINGRKRGRIKQKKLPLSICSYKDQATPKEDQTMTNSVLNKARTNKKPNARQVSSLSESPTERVTPVEIPTTWKCQDFTVSQCIKQDKVVQS